MIKSCRAFLITTTLFLSPLAVMAEHQAKDLEVGKIAVVDDLVIVTFSGDKKLDNQDACTSVKSDHQAVIDLSNNDHANYLYTHLMTAMVSKKTVHVSLHNCISINDLESLPVVISAEIVN